MNSLVEKQLFGGAIIMNMPSNVFDISKVREVPDHEEVFTHPISDQSIMIEILEYVDLEDDKAVEHHFKDLAAANQAANDCEIIELKKLDDINPPYCDSVWFLHGKQSVSKYNETAKNVVNVNLVVFRYKQFTSDILVTFNDPTNINPLSSSHAATPVHSDRWSMSQFYEMIGSFCILDFNLFQ